MKTYNQKARKREPFKQSGANDGAALSSTARTTASRFTSVAVAPSFTKMLRYSCRQKRQYFGVFA